MDTAKGIVMEMSGNEVVLLTQQGEFLKCNLHDRKVEIGDEITAPLCKVVPKRMVTNKWWLIAAAAVFLIFIIPLQFSKITKPSMVAYLSVDINPSLEMSLDREMKVIGIRELNNDANTILTKVNIKGLTAHDAVIKLTEQAYKDGFIAKNKDNAIVLTLTSNDNNLNLKDFEEKLIRSAQSVLQKENVNGFVQTIIATSSVRQEALNLGISPGKYAVYLEAVKSGLKATTNEFKKDSISIVIKNAGGEVNDIVEKAHNEKNFDEIYKEYANKINHVNPPNTTIETNRKPKEDNVKKQPNRNNSDDNYQTKEFSKEKSDEKKKDNTEQSTKRILPYNNNNNNNDRETDAKRE